MSCSNFRDKNFHVKKKASCDTYGGKLGTTVLAFPGKIVLQSQLLRLQGEDLPFIIGEGFVQFGPPRLLHYHQA
jgi:hypothetical protein